MNRAAPVIGGGSFAVHLVPLMRGSGRRVTMPGAPRQAAGYVAGDFDRLELMRHHG